MLSLSGRALYAYELKSGVSSFLALHLFGRGLSSCDGFVGTDRVTHEARLGVRPLVSRTLSSQNTSLRSEPRAYCLDFSI